VRHPEDRRQDVLLVADQRVSSGWRPGVGVVLHTGGMLFQFGVFAAYIPSLAVTAAVVFGMVYLAVAMAVRRAVLDVTDEVVDRVAARLAEGPVVEPAPPPSPVG
jgi:hypothetical protein